MGNERGSPIHSWRGNFQRAKERFMDAYGDSGMGITNRITRKYPQQLLICIVSDWVLVAVDAGVRLQVTR